MSSSPSFLLLNGSNLLPGQGTGEPLVYPYAFVQVREVADRHGIRVTCLDISSMDPVEAVWQRLVDDHLTEHRPVAVGITLRQVDTLISSDIIDGGLRFNPIRLTKRLIEFVRSRTDVPIILGGFGFTAMVDTVFGYLRPDYGVCGAPDGLFARFSDMLQGRNLSDIPNLVYWDGDRAVMPDQQFYPPATRPEYSETIIREIEQFYGTHRLYNPGGITGVPVELARGCPYRCTFCIEPAVKGAEWRIRDLDVVMEDVAFLARRGIYMFWMICSEINCGSKNELFLDVAERMIKIREAYGPQVIWNAYYLPRDFQPDEIQTALRSGFLGGWNDYVSLEPKSMKAAKVPYNLRQATQMVHAQNVGKAALTPDWLDWSIFLGHESNRPESIRGTLEVMLDMGVLEYYDLVTTINATRVFDVLGGDYDEAYIRRILPDDIDDYDLPSKNGFPTYYFNKSLVDCVGGIAELDELFRFLCTTVLSNEHKSNFDVGRFMSGWLSVREFRTLFADRCSLQVAPDTVARLFNPRVTKPDVIEAAREVCNQLHESSLAVEQLAAVWRPTGSESGGVSPKVAAAAARIALFCLFDGWSDACRSVLDELELTAPGGSDYTTVDAWTTPSFAVHRQLYERFGSREQLDARRDALIASERWRPGGVHHVFYQFLIAFHGIDLRPEYRPFFVASDATATAGSDARELVRS